MRLSRLHVIAVIAILFLLPSIPTSAADRNKQASKFDPSLVRVLKRSTVAQVPVIIQFSSRPGLADAKMLRRAGFIPPFVRYDVVPAIYAVGSSKGIRSLAKQPRVTFVEYDSRIPYALDRAVEAGQVKPVWDSTYKVLEEIHAGGITGRGVGVAIIDTGVDATHPDLIWKPLAEPQGKPPRTVANVKLLGARDILDDLGRGDLVDADALAVEMADTDTTSGHGTHVAGITGGSGNASQRRYKGVAPEANLIGLGAGETLFVTQALAALEWIHQNHEAYNIRIVNNSWGSVGDWDPDLSVTKAVRRLVNEDGLVVVFAAGNSGGNGSDISTNVYGNIPEVVQVANYYDRSGWLDDSSSRGDKKLERTWPHVAAPGTEIISTAAQGRPLTHYLSAQDALINLLFRYGEPNVIPAPLPEPVETKIAGHTVVAGNYASFTGTSMASPFVAGVVALMLEANPSLDPSTVRQILRDTANMPKGRAYETDGYAVGKGVVDAAEAVAVALRLGEGKSYNDALRSALVEPGSPTRINMRLPRMVEIESPADGSNIETTVIVEGQYASGPTTSAAVPLAPPPPSPVTANGAIYHMNAIDPFINTGGHTLVPGEDVTLSMRSIESNKSSLKLEAGHLSAVHRILRGDSVAYGPFDAEVRQTSSLLSADSELRADSDWSVPLDAPQGDYIFEGTIVFESGQTFVAVRLPFTIGKVAFSPSSRSTFVRIPHFDLEGPSARVQTVTLMSEDFEEGGGQWEVDQNANPPGSLTEWVVVDSDDSIVTAEPRSGTHAGYVGHRPGAEYASGYYYEDMANTSLISPEIDLSQVSSASLSYHRLGDSEPDYDFLRVLARPTWSDEWIQIDEISGDEYLLEWNESVVSLNDFIGNTVRLRFQFVSDELTEGAYGGWYIDDVTVTGEAGAPTISIIPTLTATLTKGVGSLETLFEASASSNISIERLELDYGDGSETFVATETVQADHVYGAGQWLARLTAFAGGHSQSTTLPIDVARPGRIEMRIADHPWNDVAAAAPGTFTFQLGAEGLPEGETSIEVRSCDAEAICVFDRHRVIVGSAGASPSSAQKLSSPMAPRAAPAIMEDSKETTSSSEITRPATVPDRPKPQPNVALGTNRENVTGPLPWIALTLLATGAAAVGYMLRRPKFSSK